MKKDCSRCLLTQYFELKQLPPNLRYFALKKWEKEAEIKIQQRKDTVIEFSLVVGSHR